METLLNGRYRLENELGQGGTGVVYRGYDTLLERAVAVKLLSSPRLGSEARARLLHEARAAAGLNHPNIIVIYDAGESGDLAYIVMELLSGDSLYTHKPADLPESLKIAQQICAALEHAHAHGVIHRDLKPENVILSPEGVAKLTDFGLAVSGASRLSSEGMILGTIYYLPPEQALGHAVDGRTDLYALGVMLYEMVAGRLPFSEGDPLAIISQHLYSPVIPPRTYNPALPAALDALIIQLLGKRPQDRPGSAHQVRDTLEAMIQQPALLELPGGEERSPLEQLVRGRLVNREREFAEARTLWAQASTALAEQTILCLTGESGVGKTPLVLELAALAEVSGGRAFGGECFAEGMVPYAPFTQIIQSAFRPGLSLPEIVLADLITLAPDLRLQFEVLAPNQPLDPRGEQQRLFESVYAFFASLAATAPLLLILEDVQWADAGSLFLVRHLARRCRTSRLRVMFLLTYRAEEIQEPCCLRDVLLDLDRERLAVKIHLARFDRLQTRRLLKMMFQEELPTSLVEAIYRETEGNHFYIEQVCKALIEQEKLVRQDGRWRLNQLEKIELPQSVRQTILARLDKLPTAAQESLRLAALIGREFDFDTLTGASELDEEALIEALEKAERAQLIFEMKNGHIGQVRFAFAHGLIATALQDSTSAVRRRRLHRRLADTLERLHPEDDAVLAYHYSRCGEGEHARRHYRRAAERALRVHANEEAIHFYSEALGLLPEDHPDRFELLSRRAEVYDITAQREAQLADAREMLALAEQHGDEKRRCDAWLALADCYLASDHILARGPAEKAIEIARTLGDPLRQAHGLRRLGWGAYQRFDFYGSRRAMEAAVDLYRQVGEPVQAAYCLGLLSLSLANMGERDEGLRAAEEALALSRAAGDRRQEAVILRRLAVNTVDEKSPEEALPLAEAALALNRAIGDRAEECHALNVLGVIYGHLERIDDSCAAFEESLRSAEAINLSIGIWNALSNLAWDIDYYFGDIQRGLERMESYLEKALQSGDEFLIRNIHLHRAQFLDSLGQFQRALEITQTIHPLTQKLFSPATQASFLAYVASLQAHLGHFDIARQTLSESLELATSSGNPFDMIEPHLSVAYVASLSRDPSEWRAGLAHARTVVEMSANLREQKIRGLRDSAMLLLALGERKEALQCIGEAVRHIRKPVYPWALEQFDFILYQALQAAGRTREAVEALQRAYDRVLLVAEKTSDPLLRQSWLENVPENRAILAAWGNWKEYGK